MSSVAVPSGPVITPNDRLAMTLAMGIILHAIFILGIGFAEEKTPKVRFDTMEIVLVQQQSETPDNAKLLAQASLEGGGDTDEKLTPTTDTPAPFPEPLEQKTAPPVIEPSPPQPAEPAPVETVTEVIEPEPIPPVEELVTEVDNEAEVPLPPPEEPVKKPVETKPVEKPPEVAKKPETAKSVETPTPPAPETPPLPSAAELVSRSMEIAALQARIARKKQAKAERPRRKFISANTKEYDFAAYMEGWRAKVERVGNLNYPEAARKQNLNGSLIMDVAVNPDGSINEIIIRKSSGHKVLDDAAIRIVNLAAPFAVFPPHIREQVDILHITRTWKFTDQKSFASK